MNWEKALKTNKPLPCGDQIKLWRNHITHKVDKEGDLIEGINTNILAEYAAFMRSQKAKRRSGIYPSSEFENYCLLFNCHNSFLGPRWTMPFCYFGVEYKDCFRSIAGLDVGCNVLSKSLKGHSDRFISYIKRAGVYSHEYETFIPHYQYYRSWGCNMRGIDIRPIYNSPWIFQSDLRMLEFEDESFDFFSVAMIIGPSNPASTILEAAMCFSELHRTSTREALIYIADFVITPSVIFLAIESGFRVFINRTYSKGIPIGVFLVRTDSIMQVSSFRNIMPDLEAQEISIVSSEHLYIEKRDLLKKEVLSEQNDCNKKL
ncbi:MAG: hypothetical protein WC899_08540 [bacterium]|jgi:hypothetical protein